MRAISEDGLREVDFWLEQSPEGLQAMLEDIKKNGAAGLQYTLNTIDLSTREGFARSFDGYRLDAFHHFNQSLQHYFDTSSKVDTQFAVGAGSN